MAKQIDPVPSLTLVAGLWSDTCSRQSNGSGCGSGGRDHPHSSEINMEAVIATGGKQYRVAPGQVIKVERLGKSQGSGVEFDKVLLVNRDGQVTVEPAALASARVTGQVLSEKKGAKVL